MRARSTLSVRDGFTLLEMMLAVTIMLMVFAMAVPVFRSQLRAMDDHAGHFDAQQNVRFAISTIEREMRVAGAGVLDRQPMIVQATPFAVTFNADYATRDPKSEGGAFGAVYLDPDLPVGSTMSMSPSVKTALPLSSVKYPDSVYRASGTQPSSAETISFWVALDGSPGSNGRYALLRRVNAGPIDTLARGIVINAGEDPPFTYITYGSGVPAAIPQSSLPAYHVAVHGSSADVGASALTDAIRAIKVHLVGTSVQRDGKVSQRPADATIRLLNAGLLNHTTCGEPPVFGQPVSWAYGASPNPQVTLTWTPAVDESSGEKDVEHYAIYRRLATEAEFGEPIASVPPGSNQYSDTQIVGGQTLVYAVAAADCGGQLSLFATTSQVQVPIVP